MLAAMNLQTPDRVPVMCQLSFGHMLQQLEVTPSEFWFDAGIFAQGLVELRELYRFDGILVSLHGHSREWRKDIVTVEQRGEQEILTFGDREMVFPRDDLPMVRHASPPQRPSIGDVKVEDLPDPIDYIPVSQDLYFHIDPEHKFEVFNLLHAAVGDDYSIHGEVTSPFDYLLDYLGHESALMALVMDPEKCKTILQHFTDGIVELAEGMCGKFIDAIKISSPFAGMGFISPTFYTEFVVPYEGQIIRAVKERGKHVYLHTCGAIGDRLEAMAQSGASGLECLDPPPMGNVELEDAVERIGRTMFIKGNVDSVNTLLHGSERDLVSDVRMRLQVGMGSKGFILSTACSVAPQVERGRIMELVRLTEKVGLFV
jgi:hypothetical protein